MCSVSLHLLIGALLVLAVENEVSAMTTSAENTTLIVSMPIDNSTISNTTSDDFQNDFTTSFPSESNATSSNTTDEPENNSGFPTTYPSEHPSNDDDTTEDPRTTQLRTKMTPSTTSKTTKAPVSSKSHGSTYVVIVVIVIVCISGVAIYCCLQKKSRKYSVDLHPKQEDTHIPLSTVDPVEVFDTTSVKDMQTFTVESTEPLKDSDPVKEAEKPEEGKESVDVKQENQQNSSRPPSTVIPKDKTEELTIVDMTDGEPTISTKTSMESLDDVLNENNSNNIRVEDI